MQNNQRLLSVGEIATRSGVAVSTIHYYESQGLLRSSRNQGNQRRFPPVVLRYIAIIKAAQNVGLDLKEIRNILQLYPPNSILTARQWRDISTQLKQFLDEKITYFLKIKNQLDKCIGCGCLSLRNCKLRNPADILAKTGSGARLLDSKTDAINSA